MIWFEHFLILISVSGLLCEGCNHEKQLECDRNLVPHVFPDSPEELLQMCRNVQTFGYCVVDANEGCENLIGPDLTSVRRSLDYLNETCKEDNPVFKAISSNLKCIERLSTNLPRRCTIGMSQKNSETINALMQRHYENNQRQTLDCLYGLQEITCNAMTLGYHCGQEMRDAFEQLLRHVHPEYQECTEEILEELQPFYEVFQAAVHEQLQLENEINVSD